MNRQSVSQALENKLALLIAFEAYSQNMVMLNVEHWDEYLDKRSEVITQINKINVMLAQHVAIDDESLTAIKVQINEKMFVLQALEATLNAKAREMRIELLDQIKNNNQTHKIRKFVTNTTNE